MASDIKNKVILITGASAGIGKACALTLAKDGAQLILAARRVEKLEALKKELLAIDAALKIHLMELDVRDSAAIQKTITGLPAEFSDIDVLINNAGLALGAEKLYEGNTEDWDTMIDTNIKGLLYVTRAVLPKMVENNKGHIINMGSIAGRESYAGGAVYCATKHAVVAITEALKKDLLGTNIRISLMSPGMVSTEFSQVRFKGDESKAKAVYQGMRPLKPEDIAEAVKYCIACPEHVNISEMLILSIDQSSATTVHRER